MFFIEIHERGTNSPGLVNISHIVSVIPDRTTNHCMILCYNSSKWLNVSESYKEVCSMVGYSDELLNRRFQLVEQMLEEGRITNNEARILVDHDPVVESPNLKE